MKRLAFVLLAILALSFTYKNKKFKGPEGYVFIPSGTIELQEQKYSCNAFWMSDHEVTNAEYRGFLNDLKKKGKQKEYELAFPDTLQWLKIGGDLDAMAKMYFWHPAYEDYPVVNISKEGVKLYCKYLTEKYMAVYGDVIQDFRLPTRMEWMYAAASGRSNCKYSWNGPYLRKADGDLQANFRQVGDHNITLTENGPQVVQDSLRFYEEISDDAYIIAPSKSYWPNDYGLYNMSGNVAELVAKEDIAVGGDWHLPGYDIQITSKKKCDHANPFTGFRPVMSFVAPKK